MRSPVVTNVRTFSCDAAKENSAKRVKVSLGVSVKLRKMREIF